MARQLYKVWPLVSGLRGFNGQGSEVDLTVGIAGWMGQEEAFAARDAGEVKLMAGADPRSLQVPERKVMRPDIEAPPVAVTGSSGGKPPKAEQAPAASPEAAAAAPEAAAPT